MPKVNMYAAEKEYIHLVKQGPGTASGCVKVTSKGNHESIKGESYRHIKGIKGNHESIKIESCRHIRGIKGESKPRVGVSKENTNEYPAH